MEWPKFLRPKRLFKYLWFGFGLAGLLITVNYYWPNLFPSLKNGNLVKGVQTQLSEDLSNEPVSVEVLKDLDPQTASQVLGSVVKQEVTKILETTTQEVVNFPQKQVRKIKIGACEELLEEDICAVAQELQCPAD